MLLVARAVTMSPPRGESRGAHQREDLPGMLSQWRLNQVTRLESGRLGAHAGARRRYGGGRTMT